MSELARLDVRPDDIDCVVLTHLHSDHSSGAVLEGVPAFPNARFVLQRAELGWASAAIQEAVVRPLADQLDILDGNSTVAKGVSVISTPGHTPGHQSVRVGDLVLSGDVVLHPVQLRNPSITYVYDDDPVLAARTRESLLGELKQRGGVLGTGHFAESFTQV